MTDTMKVSDVLEYAIKIEHESMLFYNNAAVQMVNPEAKELVELLAGEEIDHESRLIDKLKKIGDELTIKLDRTDLDQLISVSEINAFDDEKTVLETALQREKNTRNFYAQVATMTNLDADIVDLFDELYNQESGHVKKITNRLAKL
ncbi:MAG: ferritin family protein [Deltaproteobacteria bacterium]|nr:ferritin family protein [Deltaproteobacteria bacterium]